jgi:hypothetical protein
MAKVVTFSRHFPSYHPRRGEPTFFVEKLLNSMDLLTGKIYWPLLVELNPHLPEELLDKFFLSLDFDEVLIKNHTIRGGERFKEGDSFSPRVWSGKPYCSKQITLVPDTPVVNTHSFEVNGDYLLNGKSLSLKDLMRVAANDGLHVDDLECWFNKEMIGQTICWNKVNY